MPFPEGIHFCERAVFGAFAAFGEFGFDMRKAAGEFGVGAAQGRFGFDAALARYQAAAPPRSPLVEEWRQFQREIAAGQARTRALRAVAARCNVIPVSTAISALVQAEIQGSSISNILARQADDVRQQRRNQVILKAQSLPVKLVFPLMICFLPGIFLITLGPAFLEFVNLADQIIQDTAR